MSEYTDNTSFAGTTACAAESTDALTGPELGKPAPNFETKIGQTEINLGDFRKRWLILLTHAGEVLPLSKTRTIHYVLCKRRTKVVALGEAPDMESGGSFLKKYVRRHNIMVIDDPERKIAESYGLKSVPEEKEMKGAFIIDPSGILRAKLFSPLSAEQNFYDILKIRDALHAADEKKARNHAVKSWRQRFSVTIRTRPAAGQG